MYRPNPVLMLHLKRRKQGWDLPVSHLHQLVIFSLILALDCIRYVVFFRILVSCESTDICSQDTVNNYIDCHLKVKGCWYFLKIVKYRCGWCGSVDWAPAREQKGHWFDSQSGHVPGLQAGSLVGGVWEATDRCFSPSLPPSLPLSLKINK